MYTVTSFSDRNVHSHTLYAAHSPESVVLHYSKFLKTYCSNRLRPQHLLKRQRIDMHPLLREKAKLLGPREQREQSFNKKGDRSKLRTRRAVGEGGESV